MRLLLGLALAAPLALGGCGFVVVPIPLIAPTPAKAPAETPVEP